ncbi:MAG: CbiX/SirB N-terminal domain-containing protein, partial [Ghiorsea sp.]|nr:CbiX/SirB N-terminal domain-containing protein [Ghiorsea sp.]
DVPQLIQAAQATMLAPLFEHSDALAALVVSELTQDSKRIHLMFSGYQFTGFGRLVASLYQQSKGCTMAAMSALHGSPNISNVLQNIQVQGVKKIIIQPVLLFDGHSLDMCTTLAKQVDIELDIKPALVETTGFAALIADILTPAHPKQDTKQDTKDK